MKARRKKAGDCSTPHLPIGVVTEILCRLPIRTLIAAKLVCKSWRDLISGDTHFAKLHLSRSPTELLLRWATNESASTMLYLGNIHFHSNSVSRFMSSPLFDLPNLSRRPKTTNWVFMAFRTEIFYVNTCNGFVCFSNDYRARRTYAMICNPVTGEFITVTGPAKEEKGVKCTGYVLGFSGKADRYKVLRILMSGEVEICTIEKGSSWKNVGDCPYLIDDVNCTDFVFLEGKVHFLTKHEHNSIIACFDFDSEQFQEVPLPSLPPTSYDIFEEKAGIGRIGVIEGCLFISISRNYFFAELWVMKEYGVKDSWTKAFTYPGPCGIWTDIPLKYLDNGDMLMLEDSRLVSYNPVTCYTPGASVRGLQGVAYRPATRTPVAVASIKGFQGISYRPSLLRLKDALMGYDALVLNAKPRWREQGCEGSSSGKG